MRNIIISATFLTAIFGCSPDETGTSSGSLEGASPFAESSGVSGAPGSGLVGGLPQRTSEPEEFPPEDVTGSLANDGEDAGLNGSDGGIDIEEEGLPDVQPSPGPEEECEPPCDKGECVGGECVNPCDSCPDGSICDENGVCLNPLFFICKNSGGVYKGVFEGTFEFGVKQGSATGVAFADEGVEGAIALTLECSDLSGTVVGQFSGQFGLPESKFSFNLAGVVDFEKAEMSWALSDGTINYGGNTVTYSVSGSGLSTGNNETQWEGEWQVEGPAVVSDSQPLSKEMAPMKGAGTWIMGLDPAPEE